MILSGPIKALRHPFGDEKAIQLMAQTGFDAVDYTFNEMTERDNIWNTPAWEKYAAKLSAIAKDEGVFFNQAHVPFLFDWDKPGEMEDFIIPTIVHSFDCALALGVKTTVIHPIHHRQYKGNEQFMWDWNIEYFNRLIPIAEKAGIKLAIENMLQPDEKRGICYTSDMLSRPQVFKDFYDTLNSPVICACVDVGHSGPAGEDAANLLRTLGSRVTNIHVHDNNYLIDDHFLPYQGKIDWESVCSAFADIDYKGDFTFEVTNFLNHFATDDMIVPALNLEVAVGRHLISRIEYYKECNKNR